MQILSLRSKLRLMVLVLLPFSAVTLAQQARLLSGQNVNMVSGTEWPNGDPFLQRQNEPSIAVSTRNDLHLLAGSNDYRTVDLPGLPEGKTIGDSWMSMYFSYDGGGSWDSTLLPGYPQDQSATGMASPIFGYEASADPVVRTGSHGLFYYAGIAFTRGDNAPSAGFISRFIDLNNDERNGSIEYLGTSLYDQDDDGSDFIDKPWIAVDKPRSGAIEKTFTVNTASGPVEQTVQCGNLYVAWARIRGDGTSATSSDLMFSRSEDCGETFSTPKILSTVDTINQGASIAVDPVSGRVQVAWRQFKNSTMACVERGKWWIKRPEAWPIDEIELGGFTLEAANSFEPAFPAKGIFRQLLTAWFNTLSGADSSSITDAMIEADAWIEANPPGTTPPTAIARRGNQLRKAMYNWNRGRTTMPTCDSIQSTVSSGDVNPDAIMTAFSTDTGDNFSAPVVASGDNYFPFEQGTTEYSFRSTGYPTMTFDGQGRAYLAYTTRGLAVPDFDEIGGDGRIVVTTSPDGSSWTLPLPIDEPEQAGHQLMPALTFSRGKVFLLYYDFRNDLSAKFERFITDLPLDATTPRHTVDVRAAQADAADVPLFTNYSVVDQGSTQTSRYPFVLVGGTPDPVSQQTQYNPPNLPMFKGGLVPFFGDFIDIAAVHFVRDELGVWDFDTDPANGAPVVHAVWTDNRDVVPPLDGDWTSYVPPGNDGGSPSIFDPNQTVPVCTPGVTGPDRTQMRNQNIYTSRLTQGLAVAVPGNNRPLGAIQRSFVGFVQNLTAADKHFRLDILNQPTGGSASFRQFEALTSIQEPVEANSSIARSVYVTSTNPDASVVLLVTEVDQAGVPVANGLLATATINPDPTAPAPADASVLNAEDYTPAIFNPAVYDPQSFDPALLGNDPNVGIYSADLYTATGDPAQAALQQMALLNPAVFNPAIFNPAVFNPAVFNPAVFNPAVFNPAVFNPAVFNPAVFNPAVFNPAVFNPAVFNPAVFNPAVFNTSIVETSVVVENTGNTTAAYSVNLDLEQPPTGFLFQVMVYRTYDLPAVIDCALVTTTTQEQLVNELTPNIDGSLLNPDSTSFYIPPGDNVVVTVRIVPDPSNPADPSTIASLATLDLSQSIVPQAVDTVSANNGETVPKPVSVLAPSIPLLIIDAVSLADGAEGSFYSQLLTTSGGNGSALSWSLAPFSAPLPMGLMLNPASGEIAGTPAPGTEGVYTVTVRAQDDDQAAEQSFSLEILAAGNTLFTATAITGDASILNNGTLLVANDLGASPNPVAINGVQFGGDQSALFGSANGSGDYSSDPFSAELDAVLSDLVVTGTFGSIVLTLDGLTPGKTYRLQLLFSNDQDLAGNQMEVTLQNETYRLVDWQPDAVNLLVDFVATDTSVIAALKLDTNFVPGTLPPDALTPILNAYVLHEIN